MPTRNITCLNCGHTGMLDVHCETESVKRDNLFQHLGHNPYSGDLHYRCPSCEAVLIVDPIATLGERSVNGFPGFVTFGRHGISTRNEADIRPSVGRRRFFPWPA